MDKTQISTTYSGTKTRFADFLDCQVVSSSFVEFNKRRVAPVVSHGRKLVRGYADVNPLFQTGGVETLEMFKHRKKCVAQLEEAYINFKKIMVRKADFDDVENFLNQLIFLDTNMGESPTVQICKFGKGQIYENPNSSGIYMRNTKTIFVNVDYVSNVLKSANPVALVVVMGHEMTHFQQYELSLRVGDPKLSSKRYELALDFRDSFLASDQNCDQLFKDVVEDMRYYFSCFNSYAKKFDKCSDLEKDRMYHTISHSFYLQNLVEEDARCGEIEAVERFFDRAIQISDARGEQQWLGGLKEENLKKLEKLETKRRAEQYHYYTDFLDKLAEFDCTFEIEIGVENGYAVARPVLSTTNSNQTNIDEFREDFDETTLK